MTKTTQWKQTGIYVELAVARKSATIVVFVRDSKTGRWEGESFVLQLVSGIALIGHFGMEKLKIGQWEVGHLMRLVWETYSTFFYWSWVGGRAGTKKTKKLAVIDLVKLWSWWANSCRSVGLASRPITVGVVGQTEFCCHLWSGLLVYSDSDGESQNRFIQNIKWWEDHSLEEKSAPVMDGWIDWFTDWLTCRGGVPYRIISNRAR